MGQKLERKESFWGCCGEITPFPPTLESLAERWLSAVFPSNILKVNKSTRFKLKLPTVG